jgi:hypothetical protein
MGTPQHSLELAALSQTGGGVTKKMFNKWQTPDLPKILSKLYIVEATSTLAYY